MTEATLLTDYYVSPEALAIIQPLCVPRVGGDMSSINGPARATLDIKEP